MITYCGAPAPILDELAKVLCQLLTISEDRSDEADIKLSQCILKVLPLLRADAIQPLYLGFMEILQYTLQYSLCQPLKVRSSARLLPSAQHVIQSIGIPLYSPQPVDPKISLVSGEIIRCSYAVHR